jgi:hypothetical protein
MDRSLLFTSKFFFQICALHALMFLATVEVSAQAPSPNTTIEYIKFVQFRSTFADYKDDFRFRFYHSLAASSTYECVKQYGEASVDYFFNHTIPITTTSRTISDDIAMSFEAWEEDSFYSCNKSSNCGMGDCDYNHGNCSCDDDWHFDRGTGDKTFKLQDFEPGKENNVTIQYGNNQITYAFKYKPTPAMVSGVTYGILDATESTYKSGNLCADNKVRIAVSNALSSYNSEHNKVIQYIWEYNIGGEQESYWIVNPDYCGDMPYCNGGSPMPSSLEQLAKKSTNSFAPLAIDPGTGNDPPPACCFLSPGSTGKRTKWTRLTNSTKAYEDNGALTFDLLSLPAIANLSSNSNISFRVTTVANGVKSSSSASVTISLSPKAPILGTVEELASCPNSSNGIIKLSNVEGAGKYQYTIRPGHDNNQPCTPVAGCLTGIKSGEFTGASADITPVAGGEYTLWISNYGGTYGVCSSTKNVTIPVIPVLSVKEAEPKKDATCNGYADGEIKLAYNGGVAPYTYSLTNNTSNATGIFSGLKAGAYTANVTDGCLQVNSNTSQQITIAEPKSIKANVAGSTLTCNSPADGTVITTITDGPGMYNYYLKQGTTTISKVEDTGIVSWNVSNRAAGNYLIEIVDSQRPVCPGFSSTVSLTAPPVLTIAQSNVAMSNVSCHDGSDGKVTLVNMDMSSKYNYILTRTSDNTSYTTSATPEFGNLSGSDYKLSMKRNIEGCNDTYTYPPLLIITQPTPIAIGLSKQDITCFGLTDGKITATVSGGTAGYGYIWEQSIGASWSSLASTFNTVSARAEGTYRLKVKDTKNCPAVSDPINIVEPSKLTITNASVQDIKCFGDKGYIAMAAEGGTGTPVYQYSVGGTFTTFNASTPLNAGAYTVRAVDNNNCTTQYTGTLSITTPASALNFTFAKSDYNGVNISCFGGANGYVTLTPQGGNGGAFTGYEYAIDTQPYQASEKIESINAGNHTLYIKDGRGCIKSQITSFTQSTEKLSLSLVSKKDVACFGDLTGALEITGAGGVSPYDYTIDAGASQTSGKFTGLGAGIHAIQLTDRNNCANSYDFEVLSLNPVIEINPVVSDVKCFDGSDGQIKLSISGGVSPFVYAWAGQSSVSSDLTGIKSGDYKVTVTDKAGCKMDKAIVVYQPAQALKISVSTVPVCYGMTNGLITIKSTGGTEPYLYSIDNGNSYQISEAFNTVGIGSYAIRVKDSNECFTTASAEVVQRNDKPDPDFIVSTKESALDTLVITEISVPKPDSIEWLFDPNTIVLDNDIWQPKIRFDTEGSYSLGMKGYFGGCIYTVTRTLTINPYDPESAKTKLPEYKAINSVEVTPNPNAGQFTVTVKLNYKHRLSMVVYDIVGGTHYHGAWENVEVVTELINLRDVASGVYLLRVITPSEAKDIRILINK